jgi:hypothetical protein
MSQEKERLKEKREDLERRLVKALRFRKPQTEQDVLDYQAERRLLQQTMNIQWQTLTLFNVPIQPMWLCCASGILGAFVIRQGRLAVFSRLLRSWQISPRSEQKPSQPMPFRNSKSSSSSNSRTAADSARLDRILRIQLLVIRVSGIFIDLNVGIIVALATMSLLANYVQNEHGSLIENLVPIPLVEGRSSFSEGSCDTIVRELRKNQRFLLEQQQNGVVTDDNSSLLKTFMAIGENCQRRCAYERYLRQEQGLAANAVVLIPSPGVPPDFPIEDDDDISEVMMMMMMMVMS